MYEYHMNILYRQVDRLVDLLEEWKTLFDWDVYVKVVCRIDALVVLEDYHIDHVHIWYFHIQNMNTLFVVID
jgi:hypothetical protein